MNIAELFINLGIKGADKTVGGVMGVQKSLKDTASVSLEAKAAIIGAMYALERLFSTSNKAGTSLTNFGAVMGGHTQALQRYQYIAKQIGSTNEELAATFSNLSSQATDVLLGKGAPETIARVAQVTKMGVGEMQRILNAASQGDVEPLFQLLNKYMQAETNIGYRNKAAKDFGISQPIEAGMIRNKFNPQALAAAPTYSDKELGALANADAAWSRLGTKIEMAVGHFNAMHGGQLVNDISKITDKVITLSEAFVKLAEKAELFKWLGKVFEGWSVIFEGLTKAIDYINSKDAPNAKADKRAEAEKANDPSYVPPHLQGASEYAIKAWHDDEKRRLATKESVSQAWDGITNYVAGQYGKHVLGIAQPDEKGGSSDNLFATPGSRPDAQAVEPPSVSTPTAVSRRTTTAAGPAFPERKIRLVPPPGGHLPPPRSVATPPPSLPARQAAAAGSKGPNVVNFEQNLNFGPAAATPDKVAGAGRNGVREAYRELAAQGEGG